MSKNPNKRTLTLDLNSGASQVKRTRAQQILTSPDVQMLKLTSPELAEFLTRNPTLATPTPNGYVFPKTVTEEQARYVQGFEEALKNMHEAPGSSAITTAAALLQQQRLTFAATASSAAAIQTIEKATSAHVGRMAGAAAAAPSAAMAAAAAATSPPIPTIVFNHTEPAPAAAAAPARHPSRPSSGASGSYDSDSSGYQLPDGVQVKDEPDEDGGDSSVDGEGDDGDGSIISPIDMVSQERIKLERKRQRNRVAASKCRKRKLERISHLDVKVSNLKSENAELAAVVKKLKEAVCGLKQEVMEHAQNGCQIVMAAGAAAAEQVRM